MSMRLFPIILDRRNDPALKCFVLYTKLNDIEYSFAVNEEDNLEEALERFKTLINNNLK